MWFTSAILLLCSIWVGNCESNCDTPVHEICKLPDPGPNFRFPDSPEKLETLCSSYISFGQCYVNYQRDCPVDTPPGYVPALLHGMTTFCERNSTWFKGVVKYGTCFEKFVRNLPKDFGDNCRNKIEERPNMEYLNDRNNHPELFRCYSSIEYASCAAERFPGECGNTAKELALHLVRETGLFNIICQDFQKEAKKLMKDLGLKFDPETTEEEFGVLLQNDSVNSVQ